MTLLYCRWTEYREGLEGGATRTRGAFIPTKNVGTYAPPAPFRVGLSRRNRTGGVVRQPADYYRMPFQGMAVGLQRTSHPSGPCHPRFGGFLIPEDRESHVVPAKAGIHRTWVSASARTTFVLRWVSNPRRPQTFALGQQADVRPSEDSVLDLILFT